jgi:NADPH-dependent 2,4-dienoyl-CoA reductase/sulfur reductase-like enzyme
MAGQAKEEKLFLFKPGEDPLLRVKTGAKVQSLDREKQTLQLENGEESRYERLILAPGGRPIIPRLEGADGLEGVFAVRNLPEARKARSWITKDQKIIVLGGGLVGVKTAVYLRSSGFQISMVEKEDHLLPQALKGDAAGYVEIHFLQMGIDLYLGQTLEAAEGVRGRIKRVRVGGQWIPCDTLLLAIGSTPNISFLESSGLLEGGKLRVSSSLQTKDHRIFAAGDAVTIFAADGKKYTPWTWPQAVSQGNLAAANLYRPHPLPLKALTRVNSMNLQGLSLNMLGAFVEGSEEVSYAPQAGGILRQVFLQDGRIIGGALVGDISGAGPMHHLMINGKDSAQEISRFIKPSFGLMPRGLSDRGLGRRRARLIPGEEK